MGAALRAPLGRCDPFHLQTLVLPDDARVRSKSTAACEFQLCGMMVQKVPQQGRLLPQEVRLEASPHARVIVGSACEVFADPKCRDPEEGSFSFPTKWMARDARKHLIAQRAPDAESMRVVRLDSSRLSRVDMWSALQKISGHTFFANLLAGCARRLGGMESTKATVYLS